MGVAQSPLFSILRRELAERARHWTTFALRAGVGLFSILAAMQQLYLAAPASTPGAVGRRVFQTLVGAAFLLSCGACALSGNALARERREGTLDLVLLSEVSPFELLLGKAISAGLTTMCASLAFLPGMLLPVLAGGVGATEAAMQAAALLCTIWFAIGAGLCGAVIQPGKGKSRGPILLCGLLVIVPFLLSPLGQFGRFFGLLSPLVLMRATGGQLFTASPHLYWISLALVQGLGWGLLGIGAFLLRRTSMRYRAAAQARSPKRMREQKRAIGMGRWRPQKEDSGPIEWLAYRDGIGVGLWFSGVLALVISRGTALFVPLVGRGPRVMTAGPWLISWPFGIALALIGGWVVASVASRFLSQSRASGELELLLTTPVGAQTLISDQWKVLQAVFVWPVLLMQLALLLPACALIGLGAGTTWLWVYFGLSLVNTGLGVAALCWLGMLYATKRRSHSTAVWWAIALGQGVPWVVLLIFGLIPILPELLIFVFYTILLGFTRASLVRDMSPEAKKSLRVLTITDQDMVAGNVISST